MNKQKFYKFKKTYVCFLYWLQNYYLDAEYDAVSTNIYFR